MARSFAMFIALALAAAPAPFDPLRFFAGRTEGTASMKIVFRAAHPGRVHGTGRVQPDGSLILDQTVEEQGKPATTRRWHLRRLGPGRYGGTLTDAVGPVSAETQGDRLHIRYQGKGKVGIEQWLVLAPGGRVADNRLTATKLGIPVAKLHETIRKVD